MKFPCNAVFFSNIYNILLFIFLWLSKFYKIILE